MKIDSLFTFKSPLAMIIVVLLNGCNSSVTNFFASGINSSVFVSDSQKIPEQDVNIFNKTKEEELKKLTDLSNNNKAEDSRNKAAAITPVAALDNFFGNLKVPSFFEAREQSLRDNNKKTTKAAAASEAENVETGYKLIAPVMAADNFFKNLKTFSIFGPAEQVLVPEVEKSTSELIKHKAKFEITNALLASPVVTVASKRALASSKSLEIIATQKNTTSNFTVNTGIFPNDGKIEPGAQGTVSLSKFIFDYGQTDRQLKLAALETKASILSTHTALNSELTKILSNFVLLDGATQSLEVINAYLSTYQEREKTIKTAVSSGILSRTDLLEIEAAKNNIDSQYERLKFTQSQSKKFLKTYLGKQYSSVSDEINNRLANGYELIHLDTNVGADLLAVQKSVLETEIEIAQNFDKFRINANASVSSPSPNNNSFSTFAGFSITKPILDGGQSPATIDKKEADLEVLKQEITALEFERELVISSWETYKKYHRLDEKFLEERKEILLAKSIELERRFKAGQVDIVSLASVILTAAQAEVDVIQHRTELMNKKLEAASGLTQPCVLLDICADIQKTFPTD